MNDTTVVEMIHMSGKKPETHKLQVEAGEQIIKGGEHVKCLYVLKKGIVMVTPRAGAEVHLTQTEYVGMGNVKDGTKWSILGARPFFSMQPSPMVYTALEDCTLFTFDSRMFQTNQGETGLSHDALLAIARGLVLNSDISEIFVPKIAKALGYDIPKHPNFQELQSGIELITHERHAKKFQRMIFKSLVKLLRKHEEVSRGSVSLVGSPALVSERRKRSTTIPPPAPQSLARRAWEVSRAS